MARPISWRARLTTRLGLLKAAEQRQKDADRELARAREKDIHPRRHLVEAALEAHNMVLKRRNQVAHARRMLARERRARSDRRWQGSRAVTNEIIDIVGKRASVSSRKRRPTFGNPGSDHHVSQRNADAVDFAIAEAHGLKNEISRSLGGPVRLPDYGSFAITRNGKRYRVQGIAGTHGTGPHLHYGVRRVS